MAKMLGEIDDKGLKNVRLFGEDAVLLLDWLPDKSLDQIDLLYPDPWPKKRHHRRRFVTPEHLNPLHEQRVKLNPDFIYLRDQMALTEAEAHSLQVMYRQ